MSDGGLWQEIRRYTSGVDWQRIETGSIAGGVPDLNGCRGGVDAWIELKATRAWAVKFEEGQVGWLERRARAGGRTYLAVRRHNEGGPRLGAAVDELWLFRGLDARHVLRDGLLRAPRPIMMSEGGPRRWNWTLFLSTLFGGGEQPR